MKKITHPHLLGLFLIFLSFIAQAQTTDCNPNYIGGFSCRSSPLSNSNDNSIDFFGSYQRGVDAANQQMLMQQQIQMQQQMLEQQRQMQVQQQILNRSNTESNAPEWQIGNLVTREEGKLPNGMSRCVYHSPSDYFYIQGKRYSGYTAPVNKDDKCPSSIAVSKSTGDKR